VAIARHGFGLTRQPHSLVIGKAFGSATQLFQKHAILFLKVFNERLLLPIDPSGQHD
jgi:hypothetical protein